MRDILNGCDYEFFETYTNDDACKVHGDEKVNLILSKQGIEGMEIDDLCEKVRSDHELTKVSIVVACDSVSCDGIQKEAPKANGVISLDADDEDIGRVLKSYVEVPKRHPYRIITKVEVDGHDLKAPLSCIVENISSTGLLITSDYDLDEGSVLNLSFFLPTSKRIMTKGQVVRVIPRSAGDGGQYGVRFEGLDMNMRNEIDTFVHSRC